MDTSWIAIIGLGLGMVGHLVATVWWASKITTTLEIVRANVTDMASDGKEYATKEEVAEKMISRDQQITAIWKKVDYLSERT